MRCADARKAQVAAVRLRPDAEMMFDFATRLFRSAAEGLVELAWTDPSTAALSRARLFGLDQLEDLAEHAANLNRTPGVNVYVGAALRHSDAPQGRCGDQHVWMATAAWADLDDEAAVKAARARCVAALPNIVVLTGRVPHPRAQFWWLLDDPEHDPETVRRLNAALAHALDGDPAVVNCGRVMRLPGSIAWPVKAGRVVELVEMRLVAERPAPYLDGELPNAFPPLPSRRVNGHCPAMTGHAPWRTVLAAPVPEGQRNTTLARLAGHYLRSLLDPYEVLEIARVWNAARCQPPLSDDEVVRTVESIAAREFGRQIDD